MTTRALSWSAAALLAMLAAPAALARPQYSGAFKELYKTKDGKPKLNAANCAVCHIGMPKDAKWNLYGQAIRTALAARDVRDRAKINMALKTAGEKKSESGKTYDELIAADTQPLAGPPKPEEKPKTEASRESAGGGGGPGTVSRAEPRWVQAFNGRDLEGWTPVNDGRWTVENGLLCYTGGGHGWLRSAAQYRNYSLLVVWRYSRPDSAANDSGIFLRAGTEGRPWPTGGTQLNMGPGDNFGSVGRAPRRPDLIRRGPGEWNTYQVTVHDGLISLAINNTPAWDYAELPDRPGYLGIQAENHPFEIRDVFIFPR